MLAVAIVLATALSGATASPEPTKLNINNLLPESYREEYQRKILDLSHQAQKAAVTAAEERKVSPEPLEQKEVVETPASVVQVAQAPGDCYEAVRATWPQELWSGAYTVMEKESGARSYAIGTINYNGSQDFGCFQINNFAHAGFFQSHDWADPSQNAAYAYTIYRGRGNWTAWYAVKGILF